MREITLEQFNALLEFWDRPSHDGNDTEIVHVQVTRPLFYDDFEHVLYDVVATQGTNRVSYPENGGWRYVRPTRLTRQEEIDRCAQGARNAGFLNVDFRDRGGTHKIGFDSYDGRIVSSTVIVPGERKEKYSWSGESSHCRSVNGIWVPEHAVTLK